MGDRGGEIFRISPSKGVPPKRFPPQNILRISEKQGFPPQTHIWIDFFTGFPPISNSCIVIFNHFLSYFIVKAQKKSHFHMYIIGKT